MAKTIKEILEEKRIKVERAAGSYDYYSNLPNTDEGKEKRNKYYERCERRDDYIAELVDVMEYVDYNLNVEIVSRTMFDRLLKKADFSNLEYSGTYCQVALIQNYPYDDIYIMTLAPLTSITK